MASSPITSWQIDEKTGNTDRLYFFGLQNHCRWQLQPWNWKMLAPWKKSYDQSRQHIKKVETLLCNKGLSSQGYGFSSSHVWIWELDHKESWVLKNWCFWTVVLDKTLENSLDSKEIIPVNPKGNQSWIFIGRTDAEAEVPILWPPNVKSQLRKDPDAGQGWRQEEKGITEGEMVGWHHWLNGREFEQALGDGEDRVAWRAAVHGVTKSWTWLSIWTTTKTQCITVSWQGRVPPVKSLLARWLHEAEWESERWWSLQ